MNLKNIFKNSLKKISKRPLYLSIVSIISVTFLSSFLLELLQRSGNFWGAVWWIMGNPGNFLLSNFFILCVYLFILALLGNLWSSSAICLIIFILIGYTDIQKMSKLGEPLYPIDFYNLKYIGSLSEIVKSNVSLIFVVIMLLLVSGLVFLVQTLKKRLPKVSFNLKIRALMLASTTFFIYSFLTYNNNFMKVIVKAADIRIVLWNQPRNYAWNGFVFGMLSNLQNEIIEKPQDYSQEEILKIVDKYKAEADRINSTREANPGVKPNIIYILSETFWDPTKLTTLTFSEDPMKNIRKIASDNSSGYLLSPGFGGQTANTEFELMTGMSMYNLLTGTIPYQQNLYKKEFFPSVVDELKKQDYKTIAIHPYNRVFYQRDKVYAAFGFDKFISDKDIKYTDTLGGQYISDQSVVNQIMDLLHENDSPMFIHAVTMQNHYPFTPEKFGTDTVKVTGLPEENTPELETYTEGIKWTDAAVQNLIDALDELKEPTIVLFYGDHLPGLSKDIYVAGGMEKDDSLERERGYSETPLFIYSNYGLKKTPLNTISPSFLTVTLMDMLNEPLTPMQAMLEDLKSQLPGLKRTVLIDSNSNVQAEPDESENELLREYKLIQYDVMVGEGYSLSEMFSR